MVASKKEVLTTNELEPLMVKNNSILSATNRKEQAIDKEKDLPEEKAFGNERKLPAMDENVVFFG